MKMAGVSSPPPRTRAFSLETGTIGFAISGRLKMDSLLTEGHFRE